MQTKTNTRATMIGNFKRFFKFQRNFMTNQILEFKIKGNYVIEISKGQGFLGDTIYGMTVLEINGDHAKRLVNDPSGMFYSIAEINNAIENL